VLPEKRNAESHFELSLILNRNTSKLAFQKSVTFNPYLSWG
jgi:hypothetical protein